MAERETAGSFLARLLEACQDVSYEVPLATVLENVPEEVKVGRYYVVAMNYVCFTNWCRKVGISPNHKMLRYISDGYRLIGLNPESAVFVEVCGVDMLDDHWRRLAEIYNEMMYFVNVLGVKLVYEHC